MQTDNDTPDTSAGSPLPVEPILRPEARVVRADRSLAAMVLVVCTLGGMGIGFGFAMYLMRAQLAFAPTYATRVAAFQAPEHITWLGVGIRNFAGRNGSLVVRVYNDTAAQAAGLQPGDIVTAVDGDDINSIEELVTAVRSRHPGDVVQIGLERNGEPLVLAARLGRR